MEHAEGNSEEGTGIAIGGDGLAHVVGVTGSSNFPVTTGAFDTTQNAGQDVFVAKLDATGAGLTYATYLGGSNPAGGASQKGYGIAVDASNRAHVTGKSSASDFPTTAGAFDCGIDRAPPPRQDQIPSKGIMGGAVSN